MTSQKFFEENARLIDPRKEPVEHNTNAGLLVLAQEVAELRTQLNRANAALAELVQLSRSR